jgi:uncharacterized membrane protein YcaP (DUF421 family)
MFQFSVPWWSLIVRSITIYLALFLSLRLFGKREVGQFTLFDLVFVLLVANAVQPAMTGPDSSLGGGLIIIAALVLFNKLLAILRDKAPRKFKRLFMPNPTLIANDGMWLPDALKHEELTEFDCQMALREHGIADISEVSKAYLEPDGSISIIPKPNSSIKRTIKRRIRVLPQRH